MLIDQIDQDLLAAIKGADQTTRDALRYLKSALKNAQIEHGVDQLSDEQAQVVITREIKRRGESVESFKAAGKNEMAQNEANEIELLSQYLPEQMDESQICQAVGEYLTKNPAEADQSGRVIGEIARLLKGKADMGLVARIVREKLS